MAIAETCPSCGTRRGELSPIVCYHDWHVGPAKPELWFSFRLPAPEHSKTVSETELKKMIADARAWGGFEIVAAAAERMIELEKKPAPKPDLAAVHYTKDPSSMCPPGTSINRKAEVDQAAHVLATMLKDDLGVTVTPILLRLWLVERWDKVAELAHKIHGSK